MQSNFSKIKLTLENFKKGASALCAGAGSAFVCVKFKLNWQLVLEKKIFRFQFKFVNDSFFDVSLLYLSVEMGVVLHLNKLETPSTRMLCAKFG